MEDLWQLIEKGGVAGVLVFVGWLILNGKLRLEREYLDMREQRDRARDGEREATHGLGEAADIAERVVKHVPGGE